MFFLLDNNLVHTLKVFWVSWITKNTSYENNFDNEFTFKQDSNPHQEVDMDVEPARLQSCA